MPPDYVLGRMTAQVEVVSVLPSVKWSPSGFSCVESLRRAEVRARVPEIDRILQDVALKTQDLKFDPAARDLVQLLDDDELTGIVIYTHDLMKPDGSKEGNFYFEENKDLRLRDAAARRAMLNTWAPHVHYTLRGLEKLPNFEGEVYRGMDDYEDIVAQYQEGRTIHWGSWSSCTSDRNAALDHAGPRGVVLCIKVFTGKHLRLMSFFINEAEILLTPNHKLLVTSAPYVQDRVTYLRMTEVLDMALFKS